MRADAGYPPGAYFKMTCKQVGRFYKINGRWPAATSKDKEEQRLGAWCHKIRLKYKKGNLSEEHRAKLEKISFSLEPQYEAWAKKLCALKEYIDRGEFPQYGTPSRFFAYYLFCNYSRLPGWKKKQLDSIQFMEYYSNSIVSNEDAWHQNFSATVQFFSTHKKLPSRTSNSHLEGWLSKQRQLLKKGILADDRKQLFIDAGIDLLQNSFTKVIPQWDEQFEQLREFVLKHGEFPTKLSNIKLYNWLYNRRKQYWKGNLSKQQIKKLESIGCPWHLQPARSRKIRMLPDGLLKTAAPGTKKPQ